MRHRADASINFAVVHIVDENGNVIVSDELFDITEGKIINNSFNTCTSRN